MSHSHVTFFRLLKLLMLTCEMRRVCTEASVGRLAKKPNETRESTSNIKTISLEDETANNDVIE